MIRDQRGGGFLLVALVLAVGLCTALNLLTAAVLYDAVMSAGPGLSENATQILTGWGGGIVGIIGGIAGYTARDRQQNGPPPSEEDEGPPPTPRTP